MKKTVYLIFLLTFVHFSNAQIEEGLLMEITNGSTSDINNIDTSQLNEGTLVYDTDQKKFKGYMDGQWKEILVKPLVVTVSEKTANYTLTANDNGSILTFNSSSDVTLTIPSGLPVGYNVSVYQIGTGKVNFTGSGGATIKNRLLRFKTAGIDAGAGIVCTKTNEFHLTGDLKR